MTITAGTRLGRYEIRAQIGAGGMGEVYRARDEELNRDVAIKVLPAALSQDGDRLRRFEQEAQAVGALNHPNILAVYDVGTHDGAPYVVSELLEGESLKERLDEGQIAQRKATDYALQVAHGLAAAHEKGIVHRDLKPDNLFITRDDRVKILDFGLAKLVEPVGEGMAQTDIATRKVHTDPGTVMGTVGYMSPEQVRGRHVDHRSDIFSFGAVLYEMLSGKRAFHGDSAVETLNAILKEEPPELTKTNPNIAPALERVIWHCLEKSPERRFQSASDLGFALEALSTPSSSGLEIAKVMTAETDGRAVAVRTWFFRNPMLAWLAAALFLASTLALAALYFRRAEPRAETMRFTLAAPEHATYGDSLALSPDGRQLAFVVTGGSGDTTLAAQKALEIDNTLGEALTTLASVKQDYDWDFAGAERDYQKAIALNPNYPTAHQWYGEFLAQMGRKDESIAELRRAQELDPLSLIINEEFGTTLLFARRYDEAIVQLKKVVEMDANFAPAHFDLGGCYAKKGMYDEAIGESQKAVALTNGRSSQLAGLAYVFVKSGKRNEAQKILEQLKERQRSEYVNPSYFATIHAGLGEKDEAFASLEKAYQERSSNLLDLKADPSFDDLRDDPRFQDLLRRVGLPQ